ncbi:MAG TPA: homoserine kinase, partial [Actinomycetota bacterium]|nr:homoserine kinase [Actinomycetota bacterium]
MSQHSAEPSPFAPLETAPPELSAEIAEDILRTVFGIRGAAAQLDSERDLNFRIATPEGNRFVLKISNPSDDPRVLDMQTRAMLHIA